MDMHSNIHDLRDHREEAEAAPREGSAGGGTRTRPASQTVVAASAGAGWYHDAAIEAARREAVEARCHPVHW